MMVIPDNSLSNQWAQPMCPLTAIYSASSELVDQIGGTARPGHGEAFEHLVDRDAERHDLARILSC
jgi:hypothetical protein